MVRLLIYILHSNLSTWWSWFIPSTCTSSISIYRLHGHYEMKTLIKLILHCAGENYYPVHNQIWRFHLPNLHLWSFLWRLPIEGNCWHLTKLPTPHNWVQKSIFCFDLKYLICNLIHSPTLQFWTFHEKINPNSVIEKNPESPASSNSGKPW